MQILIKYNAVEEWFDEQFLLLDVGGLSFRKPIVRFQMRDLSGRKEFEKGISKLLNLLDSPLDLDIQGIGANGVQNILRYNNVRVYDLMVSHCDFNCVRQLCVL